MGSSDVLLGHVDRLIRILDGVEDEDHDSLIKPEWRKDPFKWARERLGLRLIPWAQYCRDKYLHHEWDGTKEPLHECAKALARGESVAVLSATGVGKTYLGAVIVLWWLDCWQGSQVVTLAPKKDQLTLHIWKEIGRLWPLFHKLHPKAELTTLRIRMRPRLSSNQDDESLGDAWGATGFACGIAADEQVAGKARGFHAEHLLFIIEETTGVHQALLNAVKLTCTAPHNLRLFFGNPDSNEDSLSQVARSPGVTSIRASGYDHPNVVADDPHLIPGATSKQKIGEWREELGEEDPIFKSRARGIPPTQSMHALIRKEWLETARANAKDETKRGELLKKREAALGVDVANSEKGDKAAFTFGRGAIALKAESVRCPDANEYGRHHIWPYIESGMVKAKRVGVDVVGVGVGCFNEVNRLCKSSGMDQRCHPLNGGEAYWEEYAGSEKFANLRSQMYWQARCDLQKGNVGNDFEDKELEEDLLAPMWTTKNGKIVVESKEDFKKRLPGRRSPDKGDSWVYWNWISQAQKVRNFDFASTTVAF
jgi:hypothetical protein